MLAFRRVEIRVFALGHMAPLALHMTMLIDAKKVLRCHVDGLGERGLLDRVRHLMHCRRVLVHLHVFADPLRGAAKVRTFRIYNENAVFLQMT